MTSLPSLRRAAILLAELPAGDARLLVARLKAEEVDRLAHEFAHGVLDDENLAERDSALACFAADLKTPAHGSLPLSVDAMRETLLAERPQTIAAVLAYLPRRQAVEFLGSLPATQQADLVRRIATTLPVAPEIVADVFDCLATRPTEPSLTSAEPAKRCA